MTKGRALILFPCIPAKAGTQALAAPPVPGRARVCSDRAAVAHTWVPAFAGMHGVGGGSRVSRSPPLSPEDEKGRGAGRP